MNVFTDTCDDPAMDTIDHVRAAQQQFTDQSGYLNTATHGLLPHRTRHALAQHTHEVATGRFRLDRADAGIARVRANYARLVGVDPDRVAQGTHVAQFVGLVAASLPSGAEILVPENEFASLVLPFTTRGDLRVREVPLEHLPEEVGPTTTLVAVSAVQSADGALAPLEDLRTACVDHGARSVVDTTQAAGWLPLSASHYDYTVCSAYKWLLGTRGSAFLTGTEESLAALPPLAANWYSAADTENSLYGISVRQADDASRFDLPPIWSAWVSLENSLSLVEEVGVEAIHAHDVGLADGLRAALDLEPKGSAIVSLEVSPRTAERVAATGITTATRDGRMRAAFHLYNTVEDIDRLVKALR